MNSQEQIMTNRQLLHTPLLRAAADWQLKQVMEWLRNNLHNSEFNRPAGHPEEIDVDWVIESLQEAMRPTKQADL